MEKGKKNRVDNYRQTGRHTHTHTHTQRQKEGPLVQKGH